MDSPNFDKVLKPYHPLLSEYPYLSKKQVLSKSPIKFIGLYFVFLIPTEITVGQFFEKLFELREKMNDEEKEE